MKRAAGQAGFTLVELLVSVTILLVIMGGLAKLLIQNSQVNRKEQMAVETQANARHCVSMITAVIRSAGWDPAETGFDSVDLDPTPLDSEQSIRVYTDLNADSDNDDADEDITIRRIGTRVEWRKTSDATQPFVVLADNITNDSDGDGTVEAVRSGLADESASDQHPGHRPLSDSGFADRQLLPVHDQQRSHDQEEPAMKSESQPLHDRRIPAPEGETAAAVPNEGSALVMAIFVLFLLTAMGASRS